MGITREAFAEQVKEALLHLYDPAYLPQSELLRLLAPNEGQTWQARTQALRRVLMQAIERLDPGSGFPLRARERRSHAILSACYARSMTAQAVMEELAISERQYWRDRKRAIKALVHQLWHEYGPPGQDQVSSSSSPPDRVDIAREEADRLASRSNPELVSLGEVVRQAVSTLQKVMQSKGTHLQFAGAGASPLVFADPTVLRQACLNLLSYAFDVATGGTVSLQILEQPESVEFVVSAVTQPGIGPSAERAHLGLTIARRLVEAQGGYLRVQVGEMGCWSVAVGMPKAHSLPVLVIDDNAATIKLFRRYLAGSRYKVVAAESGPGALELVTLVKPAAVTLDVMMPGQDGWDTLQALRARPDLGDTPVIVCSILDEPELAYSLGADDFIRKPVTQVTLLQTLDRWLGRPRGASSVHPEAPADT